MEPIDVRTLLSTLGYNGPLNMSQVVRRVTMADLNKVPADVRRLFGTAPNAAIQLGMMGIMLMTDGYTSAAVLINITHYDTIRSMWFRLEPSQYARAPMGWWPAAQASCCNKAKACVRTPMPESLTVWHCAHSGN